MKKTEHLAFIIFTVNLSIFESNICYLKYYYDNDITKSQA